MTAPVGKRYGHLTVLGLSEPYRYGNRNGKPRTARKWRVKCDCGVTLEQWPSHIRAGRTISCGHVWGGERRPAALCKVDDCPERARSLGYCTKHRQRMRNREARGVAPELWLVDEPQITSTIGPTPGPRSFTPEQLRAVDHLSQRQAAKALGVTQSCVSRWRTRLAEEASA